jgi:hypothetical protein
MILLATPKERASKIMSRIAESMLSFVIFNLLVPSSYPQLCLSLMYISDRANLFSDKLVNLSVPENETGLDGIQKGSVTCKPIGTPFLGHHFMYKLNFCRTPH